jgi:hypothetical protein
MLGFIINAPKYITKKRAGILFFEMNVFINENTIRYFILLEKFRGEICARNIY